MEWILAVFLGGLAGLYYYRRSLLVPVKIEKDADALYQSWTDIPYSVGQAGRDGHWNRAVLVLTEREIRLQSKLSKAVRFNAEMDELRGFWLTVGEIWLHAHIGTSWYVLRLRLLDNRTFVTLLSQCTAMGINPELVPTIAQHGTKTVTLYLAPHTLVISTGSLVIRTIELENLSHVTARGDTLQFFADGREWSFTLMDAERWQHALLQATIS